MKRAYFVVLFVFLYGCGASAPVKQKSASGEEFAITAASVIPSPGVVYATVSKKDGKWNLLELSPHRMAVSAGTGIERLYVDMWRKIISPDFVEFKYRESIKDEDLFECKSSYRNLKKGSYVACYSALAKNSGFGDGWFGYLKEIDGDEIAKVVSDIELIDKAKAVYYAKSASDNKCRAIYKKAQALANNHDVSPVITDKTGIADTSKIKFYVKNTIERVNNYDNCPSSASDVVVNYQVHLPFKLGSYHLGVGSSPAWKKSDNSIVASVKIGDLEKLARPKVVYTDFYGNTYYVNKLYTDSVLDVYWDDLVLEDYISFIYTLGNATKKHAEVKSITFYVNSAAIKFHVGAALPPESIYSRPERLRIPVSKLTSKQKNAMYKLKTVSKRGTPIELGVSVSYVYEGKPMTLYEVRTIKINSYKFDE